MQGGRPLVLGSSTRKNQMKDSAVPSFLREARCIVKALKQLAWLVMGRRLKVFTDSVNSLKRFSSMKVDHETDVRVLRLFFFFAREFAVG